MTNEAQNDIQNTVISEKKQEDKYPHRFKKGVSGNPAGRPKGIKNMTTLLKEQLERIHEGSGKTYGLLVMERLLEIALKKGNLKAIEMIMNRLEGLPKQYHEVESRNITFNIPAELAEKHQINAEQNDTTTYDTEDSSEEFKEV